MSTRPQTWQIVNQNPLTVLETQTREPLHNLNDILDSKLDFPFRVQLASTNLTINPSEYQTIKSDGSGGVTNSFKVAASPIQGRYKQIDLASINFNGGFTTGPFDPVSVANAPTMSPNFYVWLGIELRTDGKYYLLWGSAGPTSSIAQFPIFTSGDAICLILLQDNGTGGQWNFSEPLPEEVIIFKESNQLEIREDAVHKIAAIDLVRSSLPTGPNPIVDGTSIIDNELVLFTNPSIEGIYRASNTSTSVIWEKIIQPNNGANIQVTEGTSYFRTIWKRIQGIWRPIEVADAVKEPSGFPNRLDSTFSFNNTTRTFTIEPSNTGPGHFDFFEKGRVYRRDSQDSVTIDDIEGSWFIYYKDGVLTASHNFTEYIISDYAYVSNLYWDSTNNKYIVMGDERHGITMDGATHKYLHLSVGTVLQSGLSLSSFTTSGSGSASGDVTFGLSNGRLFDEDVDIHINHSDTPTDFHEQILAPVAKIPTYWREGANGDYRRDIATDFAVKEGTSRIQWNKYDGGVWSTEDATSDNYFVSTWIFATNSVTEPIIAMLGQAEYDNLTEAQEKEQFSFLDLANFPVAEFKLAYRMIWETSSTYTNGPKCRLADVQDLRVSPDAPFPSVSPNDHGLLSGLSDPDHPPTAVTTVGVTKDGALSEYDIDALNVFDTLNKLLGQLRLLEHPTNKKRVILTGATRVLNSGTVLGQEISNLLIKFDGAEIDFSNGNVYASDGVTSLGINFSTFLTFGNNWHWYSINLVPSSVNPDDTIGAQVLVIPSGKMGPTKEDAEKAPFASGIKIGQVAVRDGGFTLLEDIRQEDIIQLGTGSGSGSGSGDANELLERLKNRLDNNVYEYVTPNIFSNTGDSLTSTSGNAEFSVVDQAYKFDVLDTYQSLNNLDENFLSADDSELTDISEIELITYYNLEAIDTSASAYVSRDDGINWQYVNMSRIGSSDTFRGVHRFTEEPSFQLNQTIGGIIDSSFVFDGSNQAIRNFSLLSGSSILRKINTNITVTGSPKGYLQARIVRDDGLGSPSSDPNDILAISQLLNLDGISSGIHSLDLETPILGSTGYHIIMYTDGVYANEYALSGSYIEIPYSTSSAGPVLTLQGRLLSLKVRIVGGTADSLLNGYGIFYKKESVIENAQGILSQQKFLFDGIVDNLNEFELNFQPDYRILKVYETFTGQVYRFGTFTLEGTKVIFPPNTFKKSGTQELLFEQVEGTPSSFDNSDSNKQLLIANHLGSTDPDLDLSISGRGMYLRSPDGTLREITVDNSGNVISTIA